MLSHKSGATEMLLHLAIWLFQTGPYSDLIHAYVYYLHVIHVYYYVY